MHRSILGVRALALWLMATDPALAADAITAPAPCPGRQAVVLERFTSADCSDCWQADAATASGSHWLFDWISPTTPEAPMSAAAPIESRERAMRAGAPAPVAQQMLMVRSAAAPTPGLQLAVESGPAWSGYIGLQLKVNGRVPAGASGWMALVEQIPAGSEGSTVRRELVRAVAGPLPLTSRSGGGGGAIKHLAALRWPESAKPERLVARAWVESADGRWLALASERCPQR